MTLEHDLISRFFAPLCSGRGEAPAFGLLDDTALLENPAKDDLLITSDALVAGVHFFADDPPDCIAQKALAVNVSDILAKGGLPASYVLSIALPADIDSNWIETFAHGLGEAQTAYGCQLVGGDTISTPGPLMISITLLGHIKPHKMVRRQGAAIGDIVFVSGTIGDAALGLLLRLEDERLVAADLLNEHEQHLRERYLRPQPSLAMAPLVRQFASAAMDISDGLMGDFGKLCAASDVGGRIRASQVPLSCAATNLLAHNPHLLETVLTGGDDYQVLFTVPAVRAEEFVRAAGGAATRIGEIGDRAKGVHVIDGEGRLMKLSQTAYDHFGG